MISKHTFIVGCSRSGTTMLQSILANHPALTSFPETDLLYKMLDDLDYRLFGSVVGRRRLPKMVLGRLINKTGYSTQISMKHFRNFLDTVNRSDLIHLAPKNIKNIRQVFDSYVAVLDEITQGCPWIEKTPQHVFCIDYISRYIPDSRFIHIIRNGQDNVASLWDAGQRYDNFRNRFSGKDGLLKAVSYWNHATNETFKYRHHPHHVIVKYEDVTDYPLQTLEKVGKFLGIEVSPEMLRYNTQAITLSQEVWKIRQSDSIQKSESKFTKVFDIEQQNFVKNNLKNLDFS